MLQILHIFLKPIFHPQLLRSNVSKHKLDIFETLAAIDKHEVGFFSQLPEDQAKGFAAPVVLRWASAVEGDLRDWYLIAINERANQHFFDIWQHPDLQYKLLASCGFGKKERHVWISGNKSKTRKRKEFVSKYYPDANDLEIDIILQHLSDPNILGEMLIGMGLQNDEIKSIKTIFKD